MSLLDSLVNKLKGKDTSVDLVAQILATKEQRKTFTSASPQEKPDLNSSYFYINTAFPPFVNETENLQKIRRSRELAVGIIDRQIQRKSDKESPRHYKIPHFILFYTHSGEHESHEDPVLGRYQRKFIRDEATAKDRASALGKKLISCWEILYNDIEKGFNRKNTGLRLYMPNFKPS